MSVPYMLGLPNVGACGDPTFLADLAHRPSAPAGEAVLVEDYIDYQAMDLPTADPWIALAAIAMRTERVLIGTAVTPIPAARRGE